MTLTRARFDLQHQVVDPVLKPIEYPMGVTMALAAPIAAAPAIKKGDKEAPVKPGPGIYVYVCVYVYIS